MRLMLGTRVLSTAEIEAVVEAAYRLLETPGIRVENGEILDRLAGYGAVADRETLQVKFSRRFLEDFIAGSAKVDWDDKPVRFSAAAEIYQGYYLDPRDDQFREWTLERVLEYVKVAKAMPHLDSISMLGLPARDVPALLQPLYEKLYSWKYGISGGQSIWETALCPQIYEMWQIYADSTGKNIKDIFNGTIYMISPLKLGAVEAKQFMFFARKGLATRVGAMGTLGGTMPVTLAGALSLHLAERLFTGVLQRAFFGGTSLRLATSLMPLDMTTAAIRFGRPEQTLLNIAGAQVARYLGLEFSGHSGLSDAKTPGHEAGVQKVASAVFTALATGHGHIVAGLLGVDDVYSPVQMILDDHVTGALQRIAQGFDVDEQTLALDDIDKVGSEGSFLGTEHTARNFRSCLWMPTLWSTEMFSAWTSAGRRSDVDKARDRFFSIVNDGKPLENLLQEDTERRLMAIIAGAANDGAGA